MLWLGCRHNTIQEAQLMKRKENVSWWMGTGQRTWFPHLEAWLASPLTEQEQRLVTSRALVHREHAGPQSASRQWRGRPLKEREARARSCVATAVVGYPPPGLCCTR